VFFHKEKSQEMNPAIFREMEGRPDFFHSSVDAHLSGDESLCKTTIWQTNRVGCNLSYINSMPKKLTKIFSEQYFLSSKKTKN